MEEKYDINEILNQIDLDKDFNRYKNPEATQHEINKIVLEKFLKED